MKQLRWSLASADDLEQIASYLRLHHPEFSQATQERLYTAAKTLKSFPSKGRMGRKLGTRELVLHPLPYILVYSVDAEAVNILRFVHAAREERF
jgi:plasmid stabilization system protein ParE